MDISTLIAISSLYLLKSKYPNPDARKPQIELSLHSQLNALK